MFARYSTFVFLLILSAFFFTSARPASRDSRPDPAVTATKPEHPAFSNGHRP